MRGMRSGSVSITKFGESVNEDAVMARDKVIAVSDGAGGGGVYAERWSRYLLENLPDEPIGSFAELDGWVERIWEPFYNEHEEMANVSRQVLRRRLFCHACCGMEGVGE